MYRWLKKTGWVAALSVLTGTLCSPMQAQARDREEEPAALTLEQVQDLALSNSSLYEETEEKISRKQGSLAQGDEGQYEMLKLQWELAFLEQERGNLEYRIREEAAGLFADVYAGRGETRMLADRIRQLEASCRQGSWKVRIGQMESSDLNTQEQELADLETEYSGKLREVEAAQEELSRQIQVEITEETVLEAPSVGELFESSDLSELIASALENSRTYDPARMERRLSLLQLTVNEILLDQQYGSRAQEVLSCLSPIEDGEEIDETELEDVYDAFLESVKSPETGQASIRFTEIPEDWYKGGEEEADCVEDDPELLYREAVKYAELCREAEQDRRDLEQNIAEELDQILSLQESYDRLNETAVGKQESLSKDRILCRTGRLPKETVSGEEGLLAELERDKARTLAEIVRRFAALDRLTWGGAGRYLTDDEKKDGQDLEPEEKKPVYYSEEQIEEWEIAPFLLVCRPGEESGNGETGSPKGGM